MPKSVCTYLWHARKQVGARAASKNNASDVERPAPDLTRCYFRSHSKCRGKHVIMLDLYAGTVRVCEKHAPLVETPKRAKSGG